MFSKLSIIVPCYNEALFVTQVLQKVLDTKLDRPLLKEIIVVDDGSTDNSFQVVQSFIENGNSCIKIIRNEKNSGKGFSIMAAMGHVTGEIVIIQDADLEYDPADYNKLLRPLWENRA